MKVLISSIGSRGDVQPLLALALELRSLGSEPSLCVPPNFKDWVESFGLRCFPIGPDVKNVALASTKWANPAKWSAEQLRQLAASTVRGQFQVLREAARGCDVIVAATALQAATRSIAELLKIPYVFVATSPLVLPETDYPVVKIGSHAPHWVPSIVQRLLSKRNERTFHDSLVATLNEERAKVGLSPVARAQRRRFKERAWLAADPMLAPASAASRRPEVVQTGAWLLPDQSSLPAELEQFLANGEPPVYFGFGSMRGPAQTSRMLIEAARASGLRSIISQGWGNLSLVDSGADCISIGDVNHEKLFARVAAIVHHGGAGTTTAATKSGKPQVIIPHMHDQFYWARRVQKLGVGVSCPPRELLTVAALAAALRKCMQFEVKARAQALARRVAQYGAKFAARQLATQFGSQRGDHGPMS
jgi:vancomycin aglycone glucosyltransferase